jgi:hypothetical protein
MNRIALVIAVVALATPVAAEVARLPNHNAADVKAICAKQHGVFWDHGSLFGCTMARGTVQCDGAHCVGYPKQRPAYQRPPPQPPPQPWQWHDEPWPQQQNQW